MGHHFVPIYYLSGFTRDERLWVYDKATRKAFKSQPDAIANERELYTEELEGWLNNSIEQPANRVLAKIRRRDSLSAEDREALAAYIVTLLKRGPVGRARVMEKIPDTVKEITDNLEKEIHELKGREVLTNERYFNLLAQTVKAREKLIANPPIETWWGLLDPSTSRNIVTVLLRMSWAFLIDPRGEVLTSDNPVYFFPWAGIGRPESELIFPIDQYTAMLATNESFPTGTYFDGNGVSLREINRRTMTNTDRHLIASQPLDWIPKLIANGDGPRRWLRVLDKLAR
jgi:hypothetical protein